MPFARYLALGGFKAFRDWSLLDLSPRVSVIVGRNGSGKSTLVEALLWTLGEQDLGRLRAAGATDLLFQPPAAGLTRERSEREQHLLFEYPDDGSEGFRGSTTAGREKAPEPPQEQSTDEGAVAYLVLGDESEYEDAEDGCGCCCQAVVEQRRGVPDGLITVTRRLCVTGKESFEIDGRPATPQDVQAALATHGLNREVVSVIRQGELERILLAEPEMRAAILAEAAGLFLEAPEKDQTRVRALEAQRLRERIRAIETGMNGSGDERATGEAAGRTADLVGSTLRSWGADERLPGGTEKVLRLLGLIEADASILQEERMRLHDSLRGVEADLARAVAEAEAREAEREESFRAAHQRVERRFARFLSTLVPGSQAELPLRLAGPPADAALDVRVAFPGGGYEPIESLSGGQRALVSFALGVALFLETPSRLLVLDEVEPALDENNLRRFNALLQEIANSKQVVVVSHQKRTKEVGDVVFGVDVTGDGASMLHFRFEPATKRLILFGRARGNWLERTAALTEKERGEWSGPRSGVPAGPSRGKSETEAPEA